MWVKICGTTNLGDARLAVEAGADAVGFIFAPSRRRVNVDVGAQITAGLGPAVERVGVFTTQPVQEIVGAVRGAGLTAVQLHGAHDPALTRRLAGELGGEVRLVQVVRFDVGWEAEAEVERGFREPLRRAAEDTALWAVLLDAAQGAASGGLGLTFAWERAAEVTEEIFGEGAPKLLLAGGLDAGNVREAIHVLRPWGVDCVSGVEVSPGRKDAAKVRAFIEAARGAR